MRTQDMSSAKRLTPQAPVHDKPAAWTKVMLAALLCQSLIGCTTWSNPNFPSQELAARQLTVDDARCTLVARGSAPMPEVRAYQDGGKTYNFNAQSRTYTPGLGYSNSTYTGTAASYPSAATAFSTGFANGASMGQAIAASLAQKKAFKACMYQLGWHDRPIANHEAKSTAQTSDNPLQNLPALLSPRDEWHAEAREFLAIFPHYNRSDALLRRLDDEVKRVANEPLDLSGPEIMLKSHDRLGQDPFPNENLKAKQLYRQAAQGNHAAQGVLGSEYTLHDGLTKYDPARAAFWFKKAALQGNSDALIALGMLYFQGLGVPADKALAHRLVNQAIQQGNEVGAEILAEFAKDSAESATTGHTADTR